MYEQENAFYEANIDTLKKQYLNKELVIAGEKIIGVYNDVGTAYRETLKTRKEGTFTIKHVHEHPELIRVPVFFEGTSL